MPEERCLEGQVGFGVVGAYGDGAVVIPIRGVLEFNGCLRNTA